MPRFSNILCPIDFDKNSLTAVPLASELARDGSATLYLLHVVALPSGLDALSLRKMESEARTRLERFCHQKLKVGTRYELLVMIGDPAVEVLRVATRLRVDLIVMATHGRKGLRRLFLGSVAERVVRGAQCPVLTAKPRATRAGASRTRPRAKRTHAK